MLNTAFIVISALLTVARCQHRPVALNVWHDPPSNNAYTSYPQQHSQPAYPAHAVYPVQYAQQLQQPAVACSAYHPGQSSQQQPAVAHPAYHAAHSWQQQPHCAPSPPTLAYPYAPFTQHSAAQSQPSSTYAHHYGMIGHHTAYNPHDGYTTHITSQGQTYASKERRPVRF